MKPITAIAVLLLVVTSLSVAGCVNTPSDQTPTPSASATPSATPSIQSDKTFTSDQGFNITYPKTWGLSVNNST
ncbi:MAG: hypothetical protein ACXW1Q_06770, partial [Halobacteriota archaeon]